MPREAPALEEHAERHRQAGAEAAGEGGAERGGDDRGEAEREGAYAGLDGAVAAHVLQVQHDEEDHAEQDEEVDGGDDGADGQRRVAEEAHRQQRVGDPVLVEAEGDQDREAA